jgi:hypothetical protein
VSCPELCTGAGCALVRSVIGRMYTVTAIATANIRPPVIIKFLVCTI